ncbi:MAG: hypothetical protein ABII80_01590 [bacterium]
MSRERDFSGREQEYEKQYSVWYYWWMQQYSEEGKEVLGEVIRSNNETWAAEHVFKANYHEFELELVNGRLRSPYFGKKTLVEMCEDAVIIREKAGADLVRAENEKIGVRKLEEILGKMRVGETAVLISPPDPNDKNMGKYNMIYVYEKQEVGKIKGTAIRDEKSSIEDLRVLANYLSGVSSWGSASHLEFVAKPFTTHLRYDEVVKEVGIEKRDQLPSWVEEMAGGVVEAMLKELEEGRVEGAKEIFDAYQMAVKTRYEKEKRNDENIVWIEPLQMITSEELWMRAQRSFLSAGGREMVEAGGACGRGEIGLRNELMDNNLTSGLLGIQEDQLKVEESYSFDHEGKCRVCKVDPKKLGPCNICRDCDHKIRQQASE